MPESAVEAYLSRRVKDLGGTTRKAAWIGRSGCPDRLLLFPGVSCWVEVKQESGRLSRQQELELAMLRNAGMRCEVVWSKGEVDALLSSLLQKV